MIQKYAELDIHGYIVFHNNNKFNFTHFLKKFYFNYYDKKFLMYMHNSDVIILSTTTD